VTWGCGVSPRHSHTYVALPLPKTMCVRWHRNDVLWHTCRESTKSCRPEAAALKAELRQLCGHLALPVAPKTDLQCRGKLSGSIHHQTTIDTFPSMCRIHDPHRLAHTNGRGGVAVTTTTPLLTFGHYRWCCSLVLESFAQLHSMSMCKCCNCGCTRACVHVCFALPCMRWRENSFA
jgi:hypothetical protein